MLEREHAARAAEADRHFVEDQQRAMAVARVAHDPIVGGRRDLHVGAAHRFDDDGADVLFLCQHVVEVLGALCGAGAAAAEAHAPRIAWRRMLGARQQRAHSFAKDRFAADRDRVERRAVEAVPRAKASCGGPSRAARASMPCRSRACRQARTALCRADRRERGELRREIDGLRVGEAPGREGQRVELALDGGHHMRMPIAHLVDVVAVEIHHAAAFDIGEPDSVAGGERVEARGGQRLVQKVIGVGVEQRARRRMHVLRFERPTQRRSVDVSLGGAGSSGGSASFIVSGTGNHHGSE